MKNKPQVNIDSEKTWQLAGLVTLCARFVQGWIFWGGGSRRFIYDPAKLDPYSAEWMANKLQSAVPGALLGVGQVVSFILQHFFLLYTAIILFSLAELICGLGLLFGCFTRLSAGISTIISITLMLLFGWQGSTCMDEWTMAIANLAMGLTLVLSGGAIYSVDHALLLRYPHLVNKKWFLYLASGHIPYPRMKQMSICFFIFTLFFTLSTYNFYRGSILTPYHVGPVSAGEHHLSLSQGQIHADGTVSFMLYVDGGTDAVPSHVIRIDVKDDTGKVIALWRTGELSQILPQQIHNLYDYNRLSVNAYGLVAPLSAKAIVQLRPPKPLHLSPANYQLQIYLISGNRFSLPLEFNAISPVSFYLNHLDQSLLMTEDLFLA